MLIKLTQYFKGFNPPLYQPAFISTFKMEGGYIMNDLASGLFTISYQN